ncbi:MAG TPA: SDR family NAD(P)-dependent oxidoreductase [Hyphomicrobiaceae bacterium]|nr:SDR family NAD(P)-dependent oxidoreductase [Hyphomicrobiaceae bacterium]
MADATRNQDIVVITGGSEGIGLAFARAYHDAGRPLLLIARSAERLAAARSALGDTRVHTLALDITRDDALEAIDAALAGIGGQCDELVNSAGFGLSGNFASLAPGRLEALVTLNVTAAMRLMRHVLPGMIERRRGLIINVASLGGLVPGPHQAAYYASKAFLISLSEAVAAEVKAHGVRVMALAPGPISTEFHRRMGSESDLYLKLLPVQRPGTVARWARLGAALGARVIVPGLLQSIAALTLRVLPHRLSIPIMAILLRPRGRARSMSTSH